MVKTSVTGEISLDNQLSLESQLAHFTCPKTRTRMSRERYRAESSSDPYLGALSGMPTQPHKTAADDRKLANSFANGSEQAHRSSDLAITDINTRLAGRDCFRTRPATGSEAKKNHCGPPLHGTAVTGVIID